MPASTQENTLLETHATLNKMSCHIARMDGLVASSSSQHIVAFALFEFRSFRSTRTIAEPGGVIGPFPRPKLRWANHRRKSSQRPRWPAYGKGWLSDSKAEFPKLITLPPLSQSGGVKATVSNCSGNQSSSRYNTMAMRCQTGCKLSVWHRIQQQFVNHRYQPPSPDCTATMAPPPDVIQASHRHRWRASRLHGSGGGRQRSALAPSGGGAQVPSEQFPRSPLGGVAARLTGHRQTAQRLQRLPDLATQRIAVIVRECLNTTSMTRDERQCVDSFF